MVTERLAKHSPLIIGVFLGAISVIMGKVPHAAAQFTGMTVLGGHTGYLLGALVTAYLNSQKWLRSFKASSLTIIIATAVYYFLICMFRVFGIGNTEDYARMIEGFIMWSGIGLACGALSATAMWLATHVKPKLSCLGIFVTTYLGMLIVIYLYSIRLILRIYNNPMAIAGGYVARRNLAGDVFEVVFAIVLTTVLLAVAIKKSILPTR